MRGGGVDLVVEAPMRRLRASFAGSVSVLVDPDSMMDPKSALTAASTATCEVDWSVTSTAAPYHHSFDRDGAAFAPNYYELLVHITVTAHDTDREERLISALRDTHVPVPEVVGRGQLDGRPFFVMTHADGVC